MKTIILIIIAIALIGCNKEKNCTSSCGEIHNKGYFGGGIGYNFTMQNDCTGNIDYIPVSEQVWNAHESLETYCVPNGESW